MSEISHLMKEASALIPQLEIIASQNPKVQDSLNNLQKTFEDACDVLESGLFNVELFKDRILTHINDAKEIIDVIPVETDIGGINFNADINGVSRLLKELDEQANAVKTSRENVKKAEERLEFDREMLRGDEAKLRELSKKVKLELDAVFVC